MKRVKFCGRDWNDCSIVGIWGYVSFAGIRVTTVYVELVKFIGTFFSFY